VRDRPGPAEPEYKGWHQVAFIGEDSDEVTPAQLGERALVVVRCDGTVRAFDAYCPHRGAHLGFGGRLDGDAIICPFHGRRIALGGREDSAYCISEYRTLQAGGSVFVLLADQHENGLGAFVRGLTKSHWLLGGFTLEAAVNPSIVIENAVDIDHFHAVHGIEAGVRFARAASENGELTVNAWFPIPGPNPWQEEFRSGKSRFEMRFSTRVFSPNLVATELGDPPAAQIVFTAATPTPTGTTLIRVTVATPRSADGSPPDRDVVLTLLRDSKTAFEQDMVIWEHMTAAAPCRHEATDWAVAEFRQFCERFR
jgi:phenylpropionate dioxygenase-like ring-hydroxylating dioxygenase large terminal subunit